MQSPGVIEDTNDVLRPYAHLLHAALAAKLACCAATLLCDLPTLTRLSVRGSLLVLHVGCPAPLADLLESQAGPTGLLHVPHLLCPSMYVLVGRGSVSALRRYRLVNLRPNISTMDVASMLGTQGFDAVHFARPPAFLPSPWEHANGAMPLLSATCLDIAFRGAAFPPHALSLQVESGPALEVRFDRLPDPHRLPDLPAAAIRFLLQGGPPPPAPPPPPEAADGHGPSGAASAPGVGRAW